MYMWSVAAWIDNSVDRWTNTVNADSWCYVCTVGNKAVNAEARATLCDGEEPMCERMQDREREREREAQKNVIFLDSNNYK